MCQEEATGVEEIAEALILELGQAEPSAGDGWKPGDGFLILRAVPAASGSAAGSSWSVVTYQEDPAVMLRPSLSQGWAEH